MVRKILTTMMAGLVAASALIASPAAAVPVPVFTESFEDCTMPSSSPFYTGYPTAINSGDTIYVNLWISERIRCPGWKAKGQAWITQYDSGGSFPDGTHAAWLNEGPTEGSITRKISGLTAGRDYKLSLDSWTDDQDAPTSLIVKVTNGSAVTTYELEMEAGEGIQALEDVFSAAGRSVTLQLIGSTETPASPIIDNIRIVDNGATPGYVAPPKEERLPATGFDPIAALGVAGVLLAVGAGLMIARRRASRD
jgi:LPXTG-motif cell wall-anchored protein